MNDHRRPRRVLMTADAVGGVWTYALDLSRALVSRGTEVVLAVLGPTPSADQRTEAAGIAGLHLAECPGRLEWMHDPWDDVAAAGHWLLTLANDCAPDLVHLNGYAHAALAWDVPVLVVAHSCVRSWWSAARGDAVPASWCRYTAAVRAGLTRADLVVAPSAAMGAALVEHYGPLPSLRVVWNGRSRAAGGHIRKEPLILSAGRIWDAAKNIEAVCACAPDLAWPVYVAGDASGSPDEAAHWLGRLPADAVRQWMQRAEIYVLPARYEPFGLSILEAAQAGCALVVGDIPSLREVWGDAALYVPPDDRPALTRALRSLIDSSLLRRLLAARAADRAAGFTLENMAARYLEIYQELGARGPRPAARVSMTEVLCSSAGAGRRPAAAPSPS